MSWEVASIYSHHFSYPWCHLFCEVHQSLLQQSTPTTWCCHPRASRLGWCPSACKPPRFSSKDNGQTVLFLFHQTRGHFSKKYNLCPHVQLQTIVWLFLWRFWSSGFFLAERPFRLYRYRYHFTVDIDIFLPVSSSIFNFLCCCSGIDLHFSHQSTLISKRQNVSPSWAVWRHGVYTCVLLFVQMNVVPSGIWKCLPWMNQTCGGLHFFGWFLLIFPWYIHRHTSNWLKLCKLLVSCTK